MAVPCVSKPVHTHASGVVTGTFPPLTVQRRTPTIVTLTYLTLMFATATGRMSHTFTRTYTRTYTRTSTRTSTHTFSHIKGNSPDCHALLEYYAKEHPAAGPAHTTCTCAELKPLMSRLCSFSTRVEHTFEKSCVPCELYPGTT